MSIRRRITFNVLIFLCKIIFLEISVQFVGIALLNCRFGCSTVLCSFRQDLLKWNFLASDSGRQCPVCNFDVGSYRRFCSIHQWEYRDPPSIVIDKTMSRICVGVCDVL